MSWMFERTSPWSPWIWRGGVPGPAGTSQLSIVDEHGEPSIVVTFDAMDRSRVLRVAVEFSLSDSHQALVAAWLGPDLAAGMLGADDDVESYVLPEESSVPLGAAIGHLGAIARLGDDLAELRSDPDAGVAFGVAAVELVGEVAALHAVVQCEWVSTLEGLDDLLNGIGTGLNKAKFDFDRVDRDRLGELAQHATNAGAAGCTHRAVQALAGPVGLAQAAGVLAVDVVPQPVTWPIASSRPADSEADRPQSGWSPERSDGDFLFNHEASEVSGRFEPLGKNRWRVVIDPPSRQTYWVMVRDDQLRLVGGAVLRGTEDAPVETVLEVAGPPANLYVGPNPRRSGTATAQLRAAIASGRRALHVGDPDGRVEARATAMAFDVASEGSDEALEAARAQADNTRAAAAMLWWEAAQDFLGAGAQARAAAALRLSAASEADPVEAERLRLEAAVWARSAAPLEVPALDYEPFVWERLFAGRPA
ncbi:MAG: hypothetical protein GY788_07675 [bacterium]|nr:hypothetical protein [bacterium]